MTIQIETYKPLILDFCNETKQYKNKIDIPGLFLPHVLKNYDSAAKKYFYIGRDTNGWGSFDELLNHYENDDVDNYIESNNGWPRTANNFLDYTNNKSGGFWTLAARLHLRLHGINKNIPINVDLKKEYKDLLEEMGYGNVNSIETAQSLSNRGKFNCIDQAIYWDIKSKSRKFDKLKYILQIYKPHYVFIFNWDADEELMFSDINVKWIKEEYISKICSTYTIEGYNTKIIWTVHPRNLCFKSMNINQLVEIIYNRI